MVIMEMTGFATAASYSLTRGALLRTDRAAAGGALGRFDPHSKWGRYWINTMTQGTNRGPAYSAYGNHGKRAFFEGFYYPYYSVDNDGNKILPSELVNQRTLRFG